MTVFAYRAADQRGQTIDGVMEAPDTRAVVGAAAARRLLPDRDRCAGSAPPLLGLRLAGDRAGPRRRPRSGDADPAARHPGRGGAAPRPRAGHPGGAGVHAAAPRHHGRRAAQRAGRRLARRCARQAPPAPVLAPLHQHGAGGREGRRARDHAPPSGRLSRGVAGVSRRAGLRAHLPGAPRRRRRGRGGLPDDLRDPALRRHLQGPGRDDPAAHAGPARGERAASSAPGGCWRCWPRRASWGAGWCWRPRAGGSAPTGCCSACRWRARSSSRPRWRASRASWARCSRAAWP